MKKRNVSKTGLIKYLEISKGCFSQQNKSLSGGSAKIIPLCDYQEEKAMLMTAAMDGTGFLPAKMTERVAADAPNHVAVSVKACCLGYKEALAIAASCYADAFPVMPGRFFSGIVRKVGESVHGVAVNDRVCLSGFASLSTNDFRETNYYDLSGLERKDLASGYKSESCEHIVTVGQNCLSLIPPALSMTVATILCGNGVAALKGLTVAGIKQNEKVAVYGAGALGKIVLQLACRLGASTWVLTGCREEIESCHVLGADDCIAGNVEDNVMVAKALGGVDVMIVTIPLQIPVEKLIASLRINGRLVIIDSHGEEIVMYTKIGGLEVFPMAADQLEMQRQLNILMDLYMAKKIMVYPSVFPCELLHLSVNEILARQGESSIVYLA